VSPRRLRLQATMGLLRHQRQSQSEYNSLESWSSSDANMHSHSQTTFLALTFTNSSPRTSCTKSSKAPSRTTLSSGSSNTYTSSSARRRAKKSWTTLTGGARLSRFASIVACLTCRRIAAVPGYPGLRRFKTGRGFKQWTGDDSKALMKARYQPPLRSIVLLLISRRSFCPL
jgi:hypothetical protein